MKSLRHNFYLLLIIGVVAVFFYPFLILGKLPIPSDSLVGLYHPWRDEMRSKYSNGYPYKNPLITDPVRQQYPYRILAIDELKKGMLPKWNPYSFSGTPLLANIQSAVFYSLNILFWWFPNEIAWSIQVLLQPLLAAIFTYFYLRSLKISKQASLVGSISFAFSGFMVAWLTWNTIGHVAVWIPMILLANDKLIEKFSWKWAGILVFSEVSMLLAGHIQTALYALIFTSVYLLVRIWWQCHCEESVRTTKQSRFMMRLPRSLRELAMTGKRLLPFIVTGSIVLSITYIQWFSATRFIFASARMFDLPDWQRADWFIPWQHLVQFIAPDFFGNPATGNYWGVWNYGEFVGYIGLIPLILAMFAVFFRKDKKTLFFSVMLLSSLLFGLPTGIGKLPYQLNIPFLSTLQPSRIMVLIDFCLVILAAFGWDYFEKVKLTKKIKLHPIVLVTAVFVLITGLLWGVVLFSKNFGFSPEVMNDLIIAKKNLLLPSLLLIIWIIFLSVKPRLTNTSILRIIEVILLFVICADLLRFGMKFIPFTDKPLLFPKTSTIEFLQSNMGNYRMMTTDRRIMPPNVSAYYKLQSVDGYDPLYLKNYGELVAVWTRDKADISPAAFNRILTPEKYDSFIADLLGTKYMVSLNEIIDPTMKLVFAEGETKIYENIEAFPRAFLVDEVIQLENEQHVINSMFAHQDQLRKIAFTSDPVYVAPSFLESVETVQIVDYLPTKVTIKTHTQRERLLVLTDIYYPDWKVYINGFESTIFPVDFSFRGVVVPSGESIVEFRT